MAGRMGGEQVTTLNLEIVQADPERELVLVKGAVPGPRGGMVVLRDAVKAPLVKGGRRSDAPSTIDFETASPAEIRRFLRPAPAADGDPPVDRRHRPRRGRPRPDTLRHRAQRGRAAPGGDGPAGRGPGRHPVAPRPAPRSAAAGPSPSARRAPAGPVPGSSRSPQWVGGGVALGPKPRSYAQRTPKKMIQLALRSALSDRAAEGTVALVDEWAFEAPEDQGRRRRPGGARLSRAGSWSCWARTTASPTARSATCPRSRPSWPASSTPTTSWSTTGSSSPTRPCPARSAATVDGRPTAVADRRGRGRPADAEATTGRRDRRSPAPTASRPSRPPSPTHDDVADRDRGADADDEEGSGS